MFSLPFPRLSFTPPLPAPLPPPWAAQAGKRLFPQKMPLQPHCCQILDTYTQCRVKVNSQSRKQTPCPSSSQGCHSSPLCLCSGGDAHHHKANFPRVEVTDTCEKVFQVLELFTELFNDCEGKSWENSSYWIENNLAYCKKWDVNWVLEVELVYLNKIYT